DAKTLEPVEVVAVGPNGENAIADLQQVLFDEWHTKNPDKAKHIQKVPADMVLASGSGLDPHITLKAAEYQLPEVVAARAEQRKLGRTEVKRRVEAILEKHSFRPFGFLGEPLVNVLEVNLAMDEEFASK